MFTCLDFDLYTCYLVVLGYFDVMKIFLNAKMTIKMIIWSLDDDSHIGKTKRAQLN